MKKKGPFMKTVALALIIISIGVQSNAGFIDDWLVQKTETSPGYLEGQKRGYFTGGSFSARWPMNRDYLFTVEPPRVEFGCGGIDMFMGGFSFLNFEYLVQKLQRILQAAPAAAFDLALKNLCEPCSNVMKSMNAIVDELNSLQLDDCKASKVLAANILDPFKHNAKIHAEAEKRDQLFKGIEELPNKLNQIWTSNKNLPIQKQSDLLADCGPDVKAIYGTPGTSILQQIMARRGVPDDYVAVMRALIGDIMTSTVGNDGTTKHIPTPPCTESKPTSTQGFSAGDVYKREISGNDWGVCTVVSDQNRNLEQWTMNKLISIYDKTSQRSVVLTEAENQFVNTLPVPILQALKVAIASKQGKSILASLATISAKAYALAILQDIYSEISVTVSTADAQSARQGDVRPGCAMDIVRPLIPKLEEMNKRAYKQAEIAQGDYGNALREHMTILDLARRYQNFNELAYNQLAESFNAGFVARVMKTK